MATANITTVSKYVELAKKRDKLDAELTATKQKMKEIEEDLITYFSDNGLQNMRAGDRMVSLRKEIWGSLKDKIEGVKMLRKHGFGDMVKEGPNHQTFSAWIREMLERVANKSDQIDTEVNPADMLPLPDELKNQISVTEKWTLRVTK